MRRLVLLALVVSVSPAVWAASSKISKKELGDAWPLKVDEGVLECTGAGAVTFTVEGVTYAVNGLAKGTKKYKDIDPIWTPNPLPGFPNAKKNIGPLIDRGLKLCK